LDSSHWECRHYKNQFSHNLLNKISSLSLNLNKLRLMVMHQHQIKHHRINSPQQISRHLKMVLQLMHLMVK
jgi:hypothetical protein